MKLFLEDGTTILVKDGSEEVRFDVSSLRQSKLAEEDKDLFLEINAYLDTIPYTAQYNIFDAFRKIREVRDDYIKTPFKVQHQETTYWVKVIYDNIDLTDLSNFIMNKVHVNYPSNLLSKNSVGIEHLNINENINYYKEDYDGLLVLVIALRLMIPIWGEYIGLNAKATGSKHRDHQALLLLKETNLYHFYPLERLRLYIDECRNNPSNRSNLDRDAGVLDGVSSDSLVEYLLAKLLIRRVSISNIQAKSNNVSIISNIYGALKNGLNDTANTFRTNAKFDDKDYEEGREMAYVEKYKIASKLTHGDIEFIKAIANDPVNLVLQMLNEIDLDNFLILLEHNRQSNMRIQEFHRILVQWIINPVFPAQGVYELDRNEFINLITVCQYVLAEWELPELSAIMGSQMDDELFNGNSTTRSNLDPNLLEILDIYYPYRKGNPRQQDKPNMAHNDIHTFAMNHINRNFYVDIPEVYVQKLGIENKVLPCPPDIINSLAKALIKMCELMK